MKVQVKKWGNSLALRVPKAFAEETGMRHGSVVELGVEDGRLVAVPQRTRRFTLKTLLAGITRGNIHAETATGAAVGRESI